MPHTYCTWFTNIYLEETSHDLVITVELCVLTTITYSSEIDDPASSEFLAVDEQINDALNTARYMMAFPTLTVGSNPSVSFIRGPTTRSAWAIKIFINL